MTMDRKSDENNSPKWLTDELKSRVRKIYEPKYNRPLTDLEVITIAENLVSFVEHTFKFRWRMEYANGNQK